MDRKCYKHLEDACDAAAFVGTSVHGKRFDAYRADRLLRQAVERNFEIIGEAVGRVVKLSPEIATRISNYQQIVSFRNLLIHGYDLIDDALVWNVIQNDLPTLEAELRMLLAEEPT
ncbi:MAG: DUF86 domain-containing protein [Pirellulales bacterium]|nr:DUF86 domain-containing protein [Pirellulales bacterium]